MASEVDQSLLQSHEEHPFVSQKSEQELGVKNRVEQAVYSLKQQKATVLLKSALINITSNTNLMFLMILSTVPLFAFMVIYECNIQKLLSAISELVVQPSHTYYYDFETGNFIFHDESDETRKSIHSFLQIVPFYMLFSPLIELFTLTMVTNIAARTYAGDKETSISLEETVFKFKGVLITSLLVQLLSTSNIIGLFWTLANYYIFSSWLHFDYYSPENILINTLLIAFHVMFFIAFLYKFLDWSVIWNMGIVVAVLEDETGINALEVSGYCRKHNKRTGFQLMLVFFVYNVVVRVPLLLGGVLFNVIVLVLFCLGNLVKWVALVLYYYDCKAQIFLKKDDEETGKVVDRT